MAALGEQGSPCAVDWDRDRCFEWKLLQSTTEIVFLIRRSGELEMVRFMMIYGGFLK